MTKQQMQTTTKPRKFGLFRLGLLVMIPITAWLLWPQKSRQLTVNKGNTPDPSGQVKKERTKSVRLRRPRGVEPSLNDAEYQEEMLAQDTDSIQNRLDFLQTRSLKSLPKSDYTIFHRSQDLVRASLSSETNAGDTQNIATDAKRQLQLLRSETH